MGSQQRCVCDDRLRRGLLCRDRDGRCTTRKARAVSPAGFELLRIYPGGDWDLLVGTPVFTPGGLRAPLSAKGPGLDQIWNDRVFSLISHAGELFLLGRNLDTLKLCIPKMGNRGTPTTARSAYARDLERA